MTHAPSTREEAIDMIRHSRLSHRAADLAPQLRASIRLLLEPLEGRDPPLGATRLGGDPDLPGGFAWPTWPATEPTRKHDRTKPVETALAFVAQLRLSELAPLDPDGPLPRHGLMYFFYDTHTQPWCLDDTERDGARVVYVPDEATPLVRTPRPDVGQGEALRPCALRLRRELTLPSYPAGGVTDDEYDDYDRLVDLLAGEAGGEWRPVTRVLGHAQGIQDPPEECGPHGSHPHSGADASEWRLLLQLDSDEDRHGACFGDLGRVFFMIHEDDLRERRFDRAWYTLQCT